jgi:hypothetical protein
MNSPSFEAMAARSMVGKTIRIDEMAGEPQYAGKVGKVEFVDDIGQMHGTWGGCAVVYGTDRFTVLEAPR